MRALLGLTSDQSMGNPTAAIVWDTAIEDTGSFFNALHPSRLTIPAGVSAVRLYGAADFSGATGEPGGIYFQKNQTVFPGAATQIFPFSNAGPYFSIASPVIACEEGDYFELFRGADSGTLEANGYTYFGIESVG